MKLKKKQNPEQSNGSLPVIRHAAIFAEAIDRRTFLQRSGLTLGGSVLAGMLPLGMMRKAHAAESELPATPPKQGIPTVLKRSVCNHCSVGCGVIAEIQNGVWTGQEPDFDSPFNLGAHCAKGASVREAGHGVKRVKYPMKLVDGKWKRISWDQAIEEIGNKLLDIRQKYGP